MTTDLVTAGYTARIKNDELLKGLRVGSPPREIVVELTSAQRPTWRRAFATGLGGLTGLQATPFADVLCVCADGRGYWVDVTKPDVVDVIAAEPIKSLINVERLCVMVFADNTRLAAYGRGGLLWRTKDLSWDGLFEVKVTGEHITGLAWDAPHHAKVPFEVEILSGRATAGPSL